MKSYSLYICDITNEIGIELAEDEHLNELGWCIEFDKNIIIKRLLQ